METYKIEGTESSPSIAMDFVSGDISISGESYSEEAAEILLKAEEVLKENLPSISSAEINLSLGLVYFNSSSARRIMHLLLFLDEIAEEKKVNIVWQVRKGDDGMEEIGEEYGEDLDNANFKIVQV